MKKRIVLLSVVALMVVMLATSVAPAFAGVKLWDCVRFVPRDSQQVDTKAEKNALEAQGYQCTKVKKPKRV
jgi:hypothetical protein